MQQLTSIDEVQQFVRTQSHVSVCAGQTKSALSRNATATLKSLSGVVEYEPNEYTFTALAGTPVLEVNRMLAEHGQYLPFDPPLVDAGATLGGTVAAGLSGPGRYRYGGVRDFLIGCRFVNGAGELLAGGGKVVKNAAGFDIPKLMVGSLGRLGVLVELTFKVFPAREASTTVAIELSGLEAAVGLMNQLASSSEDLDCLDLEPPARLWIRISGMRDALEARMARLAKLLPDDCRLQNSDNDSEIWRSVREFEWSEPSHSLVKLPITPSQIVELEQILSDLPPVARRYSVAGNVAWLAWPPLIKTTDLTQLAKSLDRSALVLIGDQPAVEINPTAEGAAFAERLTKVFDPEGKFVA